MRNEIGTMSTFEILAITGIGVLMIVLPIPREIVGLVAVVSMYTAAKFYKIMRYWYREANK